MAWNTPPLMAKPASDTSGQPEGSQVPRAQQQLIRATRETLAAIAEDVRKGLLETVGISSRLIQEERTSIVVDLPAGTDTALIARAVDVENVEAWCDSEGRVHVAIGPWYSTKDVDQVVLCVTKVVHVLLGLHAVPQKEASGILARWLDRG